MDITYVHILMLVGKVYLQMYMDSQVFLGMVTHVQVVDTRLLFSPPHTA